MRTEDVFSGSISSTSLDDAAYGGLSSSPLQAVHPVTPASVKLEPLAMDPTLFTLPHASYSDSSIDYTMSPPNRITSLYFWTDGMPPLAVDVDRLLTASATNPYRTFLHIRVSMPHLADLRCPPNLQGVNGAVSFARPWQSIAKCQTKSWGAGRTLVTSDVGVFASVATPEVQACLGVDAMMSTQRVCAFLPDSALSRCHWLDAGEQS